MGVDSAREPAGDCLAKANEEAVHCADCPFCRISRGELPAQVVYSDEAALAFLDAHPQAPWHVLVIPRQHVDGLDRLEEATAAGRPGKDGSGQQAQQTAGHLLWVAARVARQLGLDEQGYRVVINTGPQAGQTIRHLHVHVLGGRAMRWPPG